jgi:hypothetical protein
VQMLHRSLLDDGRRVNRGLTELSRQLMVDA